MIWFPVLPPVFASFEIGVSSGALTKLGADYRDVVERADLKGQKYKDIADDLHVPIGTVMSRLFRARRQLETELTDYAEDEYGIKKAA